MPMLDTADLEVVQRLLRYLEERGYRDLPASLPELRKVLNDTVLAEALAHVTGYPFLDPEKDPPSPEAAQLLPRTFLLQGAALAHHVEPSGEVVVMVADPLDHSLITSLRSSLRRPMRLAVAPAVALRKACLAAAGQQAGRAQNPKEDLLPATPEPETEPALVDDLSGVAFAVDSWVDTAISQGATDIHFEWNQGNPRVRARIDGKLHLLERVDPAQMPAVINVIKIRSNLDTSQRLLPQDGQWNFVSKDGAIRSQLRVSIIPTVSGEEAVLRVLPREGYAPELDQLGFSASILEKLRQVSTISNGMFLVTGPTGSGKTTTLFALIKEILDTRNPKVLSVEDPVEYRLPGVSQVQVNVAVGLTFARALRAFLRQDPDVILVGEIRDQESAKIATEAAMTGHLVLGTLHTNSAPQAPIRLMEMGLEAFKVADALRGVLAQRLVPRLCPYCKLENPEAKEYLVSKHRFHPDHIQVYSKGGGCKACNHRGYKGRVAIHELLWVDDEIRRAITGEATSDQLAALARPKGYRSLFEDGLDKVVQGVISLEDLFYATEVEEG